MQSEWQKRIAIWFVGTKMHLQLSHYFVPRCATSTRRTCEFETCPEENKFDYS